jgi:hypothetical protein
MSLVLLAFALSVASAESPTPPSPLQAPATLPLLTDVDADGSVFARGADWKLACTSAGASWMPVLGSTAPRSPRLGLSPESVTLAGAAVEWSRGAQPRLVGDVVEYDRGPWLERYRLSREVVEQTFVLPAPLGAGELVLRLATGDELVHLGRDGGLVFDADGRARVRYSDVVVVDANGVRTALESRCADSRIELRIPADVLAAARYPLVIDPVIDAFDVDVDADTDTDPAIAFTNGVYLVVHEDATSAGDRDLIANRFDFDGVLLDTVGVELSTVDTFDPAVAGANTTFMAAWIHKLSPASDPAVRGRRRTATNTSQSATFEISTGSTAEAHCDIGASPNPVTHPFFVVWQQAGAQTDIVGRRVSTTGSSTAEIVLDGDQNSAINPSVSSFAGANGIWNVAWEATTVTDQRALYRAVRDDGSFVTAATVAHLNPTGVAVNPDIDGDGAQWILAFERLDPNQASARDIGASLYVFDPTHNPPVFAQDFSINLSKLELGSADALSQTNPVVAAEGNRFTYAYRSKNPLLQFPPGLSLASFAFDPENGSEFVFTQSGVSIASGLSAQPQNATMTSTRFQAVGRVALAWDQRPGATTDVVGQLHDVLGSGGVSQQQTGCGSPEPLLAVVGTPALGAPFALTPLGAVQPLLAIGPPLSIPLCTGQAGCVLGVNPLLLFAAPAGIAGPLPTEPSLLGFTFAAQVIDVLPPGTVGPHCGPPVFSQTFRVSDTRIITVQ